MPPSAADNALAVEWHIRCMSLDTDMVYRRSVNTRRPVRSGTGKFRDVVLSSLRGCCPLEPSTLRQAPLLACAQNPRRHDGRHLSGLLCFWPRAPATPAVGHFSSPSHASLLPPSDHLVVPLSFSRVSCLYVRLFVCLKTLLVSGFPSSHPSPVAVPPPYLHPLLHLHLYLHLRARPSLLAYPRISRTSHLIHRLVSLASRLHLLYLIT